MNSPRSLYTILVDETWDIPNCWDEDEKEYEDQDEDEDRAEDGYMGKDK